MQRAGRTTFCEDTGSRAPLQTCKVCVSGGEALNPACLQSSPGDLMGVGSLTLPILHGDTPNSESQSCDLQDRWQVALGEVSWLSEHKRTLDL